jgi:pimeloyl-ACP methyl ester carboxylesterase
MGKFIPMRLAFQHAGAGGRPILLLHGLAGSGDELAGPLDVLASRGWHAVAPDLRGHGRSPKPEHESDYDVRALAADLLELALDLGWRTFSVFGHEAGGVVAQELALMAPHWIDALVLQSTAPGPFPLDRNLAQGGIELVRGTGTMASLVRVYETIGHGPIGTRDDQGDDLLIRMLDCAPPAYVAILGQLLDGPDRSLRLAELQMPTLVVAGEHDAGFVDAAMDLAATIPRADLMIVRGGGHVPHLDRPDEWALMVGGFLQASLV